MVICTKYGKVGRNYYDTIKNGKITITHSNKTLNEEVNYIKSKENEITLYIKDGIVARKTIRYEKTFEDIKYGI